MYVFFVLCSLTTVGYGRFFPVTTAGKAFAMIAGIIGTFYMAMPLSIVGARFFDVFQKLKELKQKPIKEKLNRVKKKYAMLLRSFNKTNGLRKLNTAASRTLSKPRSSILERYKNDLEDFCNITLLHSVETVSPESIAEVEVCNRNHRCLQGIQCVIWFSAHTGVHLSNTTQSRLVLRELWSTLRKTTQKQATDSRLVSSNVVTV